MAEAITKLNYSTKLEAYSAGTHLKSEINQDAVKIIKKMYDFDMNIEHKNKLLDDIPEVDIVITMGCNVDCPMLPCTYREDWGLDDPTGGSEFEFNLTAKLIEEKIKNLVLRIEAGEIKL
jgi:arsenate reductase